MSKRNSEENTFFEFGSGNQEPEKGDLLLSEPFLADPNFVRTVILLCEHNEEGSVGFVINKPSSLRLGEIVQELEGVELEVFIGGPVQQDSLHFVHRRGDLFEGAVEIREGLFWGGNFEQLILMAKTTPLLPEEFKFFVGYSGWAAGQLMDEMKMNSWIISRNVNLEQVFDTQTDRLWKGVLQAMGGKYKLMSNYPVDPRLN